LWNEPPTPKSIPPKKNQKKIKKKMNFGGPGGSRQRLGGTSRPAASRDDLLRIARAERDARSHEKARHAAAVAVQCRVRGAAVRRATRAACEARAADLAALIGAGAAGEVCVHMKK
jgi:uncharacterized membrane protein YqiK